MRAQPTYHVRWRSPLGVTVGLFLFWGALNAFLAIFVPASLHSGGAGATGALVLTPEADAALLGRSLADIARDDARLNAYLVSFMDTMCAQMMAYAIVHLGLTWFALRRGQTWALWFAGAGALATFVYFIPILFEFARFDAPTDGFVFFTAIPIALIVAATVLGWYGLRRERLAVAAA
ncbi:MAG TPA: hypothetical protein VJ141_01815 [Candidatus Limnocylindrales bacterium]|nr:hypothetical protein [Candidatus Limnocylindrales bacterium]